MAKSNVRTRTHCKDCGVELNSSNEVFSSGINGARGQYRAARCKECTAVKKKENYDSIKTPERIKRWNLWNKYRITLEQFYDMYEDQQFGCSICRMRIGSEEIHVDHNHKTNEIRGLLCRTCNVTVGFVEGHEERILNSIEYLKKTTWKQEKAG